MNLNHLGKAVVSGLGYSVGAALGWWVSHVLGFGASTEANVLVLWTAFGIGTMATYLTLKRYT